MFIVFVRLTSRINVEKQERLCQPNNIHNKHVRAKRKTIDTYSCHAHAYFAVTVNARIQKQRIQRRDTFVIIKQLRNTLIIRFQLTLHCCLCQMYK